MKNLKRDFWISCLIGILLFLLNMIAVVAKPQDTLRIHHTNYSSLFNKNKNYPVVVDWWLTKSKVRCKTISNKKIDFKIDPNFINDTTLKNDFSDKIFVKSQLMSSNHNKCQDEKVLEESYYSTNVAPMHRDVKFGDWQSLEELEKTLSMKYDSIRIWSGCVGEIKRVGKTSIPQEFWKVIYIKRTKEWLAFEFINQAGEPQGLHSRQVTRADITNLTGINFALNR